MKREQIIERPDWREKATEYGFNFHTTYGEPYRCDDAYYQFSMEEMETLE
ncbi:hypothetical protein EYY80_30385, partial [Klebsiella oxytoca]